MAGTTIDPAEDYRKMSATESAKMAIAARFREIQNEIADQMKHPRRGAAASNNRIKAAIKGILTHTPFVWTKDDIEAMVLFD